MSNSASSRPRAVLDARFVTDSYPYDPQHPDLDTHLVVQVSAPDVGEVHRPQVGIVGVIDVSGSMGAGRKLETAKAALTQVLNHLTEDDCMGVVAYDNTAHLVLEPTSDLGLVAERLRAMRPGGSTNIEAALRLALGQARQLSTELRQHEHPFEVRVIIVSDGMPNVGETRADLLAEMVSDLPAGVRVSTIGVGNDCDHEMLAELAGRGGGNYGHAEDGAAISAVVGAEFGSIIEVVATDLELLVTPRRYAQVGAPLGLAHQVVGEGDGFRIRIPTLLWGETRTLVLPVALQAPGRRHARAVTAVEVYLHEGDRLETRLPKVFFRLDAAEEVATDSRLVELVDRARAAEALRHANQAARGGDLVSASTILNTASQSISSPAVGALVASAYHLYASPTAFTSSSGDRTAYITALGTGSRLLGASTSFDASWSRQMGDSYTTTATRSWALRIADEVEQTGGEEE